MKKIRNMTGRLQIVVIIMSFKADNYLMITFNEYLKNSICCISDKDLFPLCSLIVLVKRQVIFCISCTLILLIPLNPFSTPLPPHDKFYASSLFSSRRRNVFAVSDRYLYWSFKIANVFTKAEYKTVTRIK